MLDIELGGYLLANLFICLSFILCFICFCAAFCPVSCKGTTLRRYRVMSLGELLLIPRVYGGVIPCFIIQIQWNTPLATGHWPLAEVNRS